MRSEADSLFNDGYGTREGEEVLIADCAEPGQQEIKNAIAEHNLTRVVVASCSPLMHEPTFRSALQEAGLNPYLLEMANLREHCSWVHAGKREEATQKAKDLVAMAVGKAALLKPQISWRQWRS